MELFSRIVCMGMLTVCAALDVRTRRIPAGMIAAGAAGASLYQICCMAAGEGNPGLIFGAFAVGAVFVGLSWITGEGVGYGDSLGILCLGVYLGFWKLLEVLAAAFLLLAIGAAAALSVRRMNRRSRLPFYPFLAAGYALWMAAGQV